MNALSSKNCTNEVNVKFIKIGNKKVNSMSYSIKNTHKIAKFKLI